jgi:thiol-disulfide isomerase/thioredoxin
MKSAAKTIVLAAGCVLALAALGSCARKQDPPSAPSSSTLPADLTGALQKSGFAVAAKPFVPDDFTLDALDGSRLSLSSFKGKVVFLSFWATWCGPCKEELPSIQALYQKLSGKGFVVLAVDLGEGKAKVEQFVKANNLTFPVLLDGDAAVGSSYGASSIPTNYLIDRSGRIIARVVGFDGVKWTASQRIDLFNKILGM